MKNINRILLVILTIIIIILLLRGCQIEKDRQNLLQQVSSYQIGEKAFKTKILKDSSTISTQSQTILTEEEAIKLGILKLDAEIKKAQSQVVQHQKLIIDSIPVPYIPNGYTDTTGWVLKLKNGDTSKEICDSLIANSIIVPSNFGIDNKWYSIHGKVKKDGLLMDSIKIENQSTVTIGWKKTGFLNLKKEPIVEIKNTNPYLSVTKMNNVVIKKKKGLFDNKFFWVGVGAVGILLLK
jgi:hypothetical protein